MSRIRLLNLRPPRTCVGVEILGYVAVRKVPPMWVGTMLVCEDVIFVPRHPGCHLHARGTVREVVGSLRLVREDAVALRQPTVVLFERRVEEAHRSSEGNHEPWRRQLDQSADRFELAGPLLGADSYYFGLRVLVADQVPARPRHLDGYDIKLTDAFQRCTAHLADRQPRVVAVQERSATRIQEYRGVVAHGRLFRDKADPVTTVVEIELLPRIQLHYIAHADPIESVTQVWRWIAVHKQLRMRRKPGQHVGVHVVEVLVGQSRVVHIEQPGVIEMRVTWELVPGTLERAAIRQPAIHDHPKVYAVDSDPRVAEEGELDRGRGHDATASICLRRSTACDASLTITPSARPITRSTWRSLKTDLDGGATSKNPTGSQNSGI